MPLAFVNGIFLFGQLFCCSSLSPHAKVIKDSIAVNPLAATSFAADNFYHATY